MFCDHDLRGDDLPPGTLCLTFDDGPGPRTLPLATYLHRRRVPATAVAAGSQAAGHGATLARLKALGHLVANHTFDHPNLPQLVAGGGDPVDQLARTDALIREYAGDVVYVRAPYGAWRRAGQ